MSTTVRITSLGQRGEGIAEVEGRRVFVPLTLSGEEVEIAVAGERGTLLSLLAASPHRITPFCPHFGACGGCQLQHLDAETYAGFKRSLVETALSHAGIAVPVGPLVDARGTGRRRVTLHAKKTGAGFMGFHTHELHDIDHCPITVPALAGAPAIARAIYGAIGDCDVSFTATLTGIDVAVKSERKPKPDRLAPLMARFGLARLSLDGEPILVAQAPAMRMGKALLEIPPSGFLQATEAAEEILAAAVLTGLKGAENIADLFCGVGPFALRLAERTKVYAADSDKAGIASLIKAHNKTRGLKAITAERRDLFREPLTAIELNRFDGVVFDPPRAGAEAQSRELARSKVKTVVAVSCDPKTFARDAKILTEGGYGLEAVTPVDQFAFSTHVEVVGVFRR
ncbi:MAG TPA: TRAM domain-containing protein [Devosiaceae bacterium]|nr:TRAM domain-containing protein [Devosiaceae bacterium]